MPREFSANYLEAVTPEVGSNDHALPLLVFAEDACINGCANFSRRITEAEELAVDNPGVQFGVVCRKKRVITSGGHVVNLGRIVGSGDNSQFTPNTHPENGWEGTLEDVEDLVDRGMQPVIWSISPQI